MRTKEQIASILANRHSRRIFKQLSWSDLAQAVKAEKAPQKQLIVDDLINGHLEKVGRQLRRLLIKDADTKAKVRVDLMMNDSNLDMMEIDELL